MSTVHVIVPNGIDDPARPSGGNAYDRRVCAELATAGWEVREHGVAGSWPWPDAAAESALADVVHNIPDGAVVLVDGLIASAAATVLVPAAGRLQVVVLVHMAFGEQPPGHDVTDAHDRERAVLTAASAVITTSAWTRGRLLELYPLRPEQVQVATPGADAADLATGTRCGGELLCVAAVAPHKGHDVLLAALASITDLSWHCVCVGSLDRDREFVERLVDQCAVDGISERVEFTGPFTRDQLAPAYAAADVLVLASQAESYGMVVTEALARGLPVIATSVGGVAEALGRTADGRRPGVLVPPGDRRALSAALRSWLGDAEQREGLRSAARERRTTLGGWPATAARIAQVLTQVAAGGGRAMNQR